MPRRWGDQRPWVEATHSDTTGRLGHPPEYHLGGPNSTLTSFGVKKKRKKAAKPNLVFVEERAKQEKVVQVQGK